MSSILFNYDASCCECFTHCLKDMKDSLIGHKSEELFVCVFMCREESIIMIRVIYIVHADKEAHPMTG